MDRNRGDIAAAGEALVSVLDESAWMGPGEPRLLRVLASLGEARRVAAGMAQLEAGSTTAARAEAAAVAAAAMGLALPAGPDLQRELQDLTVN